MRKIIIATIIACSTISLSLHSEESQNDAFLDLKLMFIDEMNIHSIAHYYHNQDFILKKQYLRLSNKFYNRCKADSEIEASQCDYFQREFILDEWTTSEVDSRICRGNSCFNQ